MTDKHILDVTCSNRSIWFNKNHPLTVYCDKREGDFSYTFGSPQITRHCDIHPDIIADFTDLPFEDNSFELVVFDPPHMLSPNEHGWMTKRYGYYTTKEEALNSVRDGFRECMRVLKPHGTLVFKWSELSIPTREVIDAIEYEPLFGHRSGKNSGTHWMCFMKE